MKNKKIINNKKGEFGIRAYFLAMLFFAGAIGIFVIMTGSLATEYNNTEIIKGDFEGRYNHIQEFSNRIESIRNSLSSSEGINIINIGFGVFKATFSFIQLTLSSLNILKETTVNFTEDFSIPYQVAGILSTVFIGIIIITLVIRIINSLNPGKM